MVIDDFKLKKAMVILFNRYIYILKKNPFDSDIDKCDSNSLIALSREAIEKIESLPLDKLNRWLGFIQGVAILNGVLTVDGERDFSRPLFKNAYGSDVESIDVKNLKRTN